MAIEVRMPNLGLNMVEGRIVEWKKKPGESVKEGEIICVIETEKATYEIEAAGFGTLAKIVAGEGATVPVGEIMAYILGPGEELPEVLAAAPGAARARENQRHRLKKRYLRPRLKLLKLARD